MSQASVCFYGMCFWQGYLPASVDRREPTLQRKRHEYFSFIEQYYDTRHQEMHQDTFRQVSGKTYHHHHLIFLLESYI